MYKNKFIVYTQIVIYNLIILFDHKIYHQAYHIAKSFRINDMQNQYVSHNHKYVSWEISMN